MTYILVTAFEKNGTVFASIVRIAVAVVVVYLVIASAPLAGIIAITFIYVDLTVGALEARFAFAGIGSNLRINTSSILIVIR